MKARSNMQTATGMAASANGHANKARYHRDQRNKWQQILDDWDGIFVNAPVLLLSTIFLIVAVAEILSSWQMYRELLASISGNPHWLLCLIIGLSIVGLGALVSHMFARKLSSEYFDWEVYNLIQLNPRFTSEADAREEIGRQANYYLIFGLIFFVLLVSAVALLSWQRVLMQGAISEEDFPLVHKLAPIIFIIAEVLTGIYLWYLIKRWQVGRKVRRHHRVFNAEKKSCALDTQGACDALKEANTVHEEIEYNRELRDAIYRMQHYSEGSDQYVDAIPDARTIKVNVSRNGTPEQGVLVAGMLPEGVLTNSVYTSRNGSAILLWQEDAAYLETIFIRNMTYRGPFPANSEASFDLGLGSPTDRADLLLPA